MASKESIGIETRILILSDTHSALPCPANTSSHHPFRWPLPKADILLHAGDLTMNGKLEEHERALELLRGIDAELKIVIPGNHDLTLDEEYYQTYPNEHCSWSKYDDSVLRQIHDLYTGDEARAVGIVYMVEGIQTFTLKTGATFTLYASAYQPEFCNWAFGYPREQDRYNLRTTLDVNDHNRDHQIKKIEPDFRAPNPIPSFNASRQQNDNNNIDIMLTHGPPRDILDLTSRHEHVGCDHLARAVKRCRLRLHAFGHIHEAAGGLRKVWGRYNKDFAEKEEEEIEEAIIMNGTLSSSALTSTSTTASCSYNYYDASTLQFGAETVFINASIMNLQYEPVQSPWLVDLVLPSAACCVSTDWRRE